MNNWEKKSAYLLREIVKFRTYIESLTAAQSKKDKLYQEREAAGITKSAGGEASQASDTLPDPVPLQKTHTT
jgi:hypothetical protein